MRTFQNCLPQLEFDFFSFWLFGCDLWPRIFFIFCVMYPIVIHYPFCGDNDTITNNVLHLNIFFLLNNGKVAASQRTLGKSVKENVGDWGRRWVYSVWCLAFENCDSSFEQDVFLSFLLTFSQLNSSQQWVFGIKHDLARSCFQFWSKIGNEDDKILRKKLARR